MYLVKHLARALLLVPLALIIIFDIALADCPLCRAKGVGTSTNSADETSAAAKRPRRVYRLLEDGQTQLISYRTLINTLASADVVLLGEQHDDPSSHLLELDILQQLSGAREGWLALSLEMFERDVQPALDDYLAGTLEEEEFLAGARPWDNYLPDYQPLVEFCHEQGIPVFAANAPRELARRVAHQGLAPALDSMTMEELDNLAIEVSCPQDAYWQRFEAVMQEGHGEQQMTPTQIASFYEAQCLKDDTMAETIAQLRDDIAEFLVLHLTGSFHVEYGLGTVKRVSARRPDDDIVTVILRPVASFVDLSEELDALVERDIAVQHAAADYVVFVPSQDWGEDSSMGADKEES